MILAHKIIRTDGGDSQISYLFDFRHALSCHSGTSINHFQIVFQCMDQTARARLNTLAMTKPDKARMVESMILQVILSWFSFVP